MTNENQSLYLPNHEVSTLQMIAPTSLITTIAILPLQQQYDFAVAEKPLSQSELYIPAIPNPNQPYRQPNTHRYQKQVIKVSNDWNEIRNNVNRT